MAPRLMHHNGLRVNSDQFTEETIDIWREQGWAIGPHKDSDPDDPRPVPAVLPEPEPEPDDTADKATTKKGK